MHAGEWECVCPQNIEWYSIATCIIAHLENAGKRSTDSQHSVSVGTGFTLSLTARTYWRPENMLHNGYWFQGFIFMTKCFKLLCDLCLYCILNLTEYLIRLIYQIFKAPSLQSFMLIRKITLCDIIYFALIFMWKLNVLFLRIQFFFLLFSLITFL